MAMDLTAGQRLLGTVELAEHGRGGRIESAETAQHRADMDLAIIGVLADSGLGASETAVLTWGNEEL